MKNHSLGQLRGRSYFVPNVVKLDYTARNEKLLGIKWVAGLA